MAPIKVGDVIAAKYRVEKVLGAGAMGVVVAARHEDLKELRAIKFMLPTALGDAEGVERFLREARSAARLRSQHVAKVQDFGRLENGAPYIVMEYLDGGDLKALLEARGTLTVPEAAGFVLQVCEALAEAHQAGIVHRDLKPANMFLTTVAGKPCVKVLDFGIAKLSEGGPGAAEMTGTSALLGTPLYMSPEQMRSSRGVDGRSDIWALGVTLYRMLCGKTPFNGESVTEICTAVVADTPQPPRALRPDLPMALETVILKCLEKNPAQRFQSVAEFEQALRPFASGAYTSSGVPSGPVSHGPTPPAQSAHQGGATYGSASGAPHLAPGTTTHQAGAATYPGSATYPQQGTHASQAAYPQQATYPQQAAYPQQATYPQQAAYPQQATYPQQGSYPGQATYPSSGYGSPPGGPPSGIAAQSVGMMGTAAGPPSATPAQPVKSSRTALVIGAVVAVVLVGGGIAAAVTLTGGEDSSGKPSASNRGSTPVVLPGSAASAGGKASTSPTVGQKPGSAAVATPGTPSPGGAPSPSTSTPAPSTSTTAPAAPAVNAQASASLSGIAVSCWKNNEGANKGQAASSASITVSAGPPRSVLVTGPAKAQSGFTGCVVAKGGMLALAPGETAQTSVALPAGPS
ncbi:MAG: protein kinase [Polyangiaceae bacterium]|nr:protein kinase [Polyangiaceae bacterium]